MPGQAGHRHPHRLAARSADLVNPVAPAEVECPEVVFAAFGSSIDPSGQGSGEDRYIEPEQYRTVFRVGEEQIQSAYISSHFPLRAHLVAAVSNDISAAISAAIAISAAVSAISVSGISDKSGAGTRHPAQIRRDITEAKS